MSWAKLLEERGSLATALDLVGDHWSLMIVTGVLVGYRRFNKLENYLGMNRNLLKTKLDRLVAAGVFARQPYKENSKHYEYTPTDMCQKLSPIIVGLAQWGEDYLTKYDSPITNVHKQCGGGLRVVTVCNDCNEFVGPPDVALRRNEGAGEWTTSIVITANEN